MCYRCRICTQVVPHGKPMRRHVIYREVKPLERKIDLPQTLQDLQIVTKEKKTRRPVVQIAREVPICDTCGVAINFDELIKSGRVLIGKPMPNRESGVQVASTS